MKYLLILNRFDMEDKILEEKFHAKIIEKEKSRATIDTLLPLTEILNLQEVKKAIPLKQDWTDFKNFKNFTDKCLEVLESEKIEEYNIIVKFLNKTKFSAGEIQKKINTLFMAKKAKFNAEGKVFYIEFKGDRDLKFRIGVIESKLWKSTSMLQRKFENFTAVLENPESIIEISDFLRLCWIFKIPFILLGDKNKNEHYLKRAKLVTKGIDYASIKIQLLPHLPKGYIKVGFSKHAESNETQLSQFLKNTGDKKIALVFGNDKFGLTQETRDRMDKMFRLTPEENKPLRASHALSYIFGIYIGNLL